MCWAVGFALAQGQWTNGIEVLMNPGDVVSGISGGNLSMLRISLIGTLVSGLVGLLYFTQGCSQMMAEVSFTHGMEEERIG